MARMVLDDALWLKLERLLPLRENGGRPAQNNRLFIKDGDHKWHMIDGSNIRAHQHAAGAFGMPLDFVLTRGETHELTVAKELLWTDIGDYLLADRAYDSNDLRDFLASRGTEAIIPGKKNRIIPIEHDRHIYKERNFVERFFNRLKQLRRVATRYEKLAVSALGRSPVHVVTGKAWSDLQVKVLPQKGNRSHCVASLAPL